MGRWAVSRKVGSGGGTCPRRNCGARAPETNTLSDSELQTLLDHFDARQILHVTFGSVLTARSEDGKPRFKDRLFETLRSHGDAYAVNLEKHFVKHLKPFARKN